MTSACLWAPDLATPLCLRETRTTLARHEVMGKQRQIHRLLSSIAMVEAQMSLEPVARTLRGALPGGTRSGRPTGRSGGAAVSAGERVLQGALIGYSGNTGN